MISVKGKAACKKMVEAGKLLSSIFVELESRVCAGVTTLDLDSFIASRLDINGLVSQSKGYRGYKYVSCISLNDEVVHGVPSNSRVLSEGDLVKVDVCASWRGYCADMTRCFFVGVVSLDIKKLVDVAYFSLERGVSRALSGERLGDISASIQGVIENSGFSVVRDFAGHGIGSSMHEEPEILNYGDFGTGAVLKEGMAFALEPMLNFGRHNVCIDSGGWTVRTVDGSLSAHVEDTVIVSENGPIVTTALS